MNIIKDILIAKAGSPVILYDWSLPSATGDFSTSVIEGVISSNNLIFNSVYSVSDHLIDSNTDRPSTTALPGISIGAQENVLTHDNKGSFSGQDVVYIPETKAITNWTAFFDIEANALQDASKSTILLTNKKQVSDASGWVVGINGSGFLFYKFKNANGNENVKTFIKPLGEKSIVAFSKSGGLISIYVYDPFLNEMYQKGFRITEALSRRDMCIGGTFDDFSSDIKYERFSGEMNHFVLYDRAMSSEEVLNVFESFFLTAYTAKHSEDIATLFPKPGEWVKTKVKDGVRIDRYEYVESEITTNTGEVIKVYNKVPVYVANYKEELTFVNKSGNVTKMIPTVIEESSTRDENYAKTYYDKKCILLKSEIDTTEYIEIYSCDESFNNTNKIAKFLTADSSFFLDKVYNENEVQAYLDSGDGFRLLELGTDYEVIDGQKIKRIEGLFTEANTMIYDIYEVDKVYFDFYGYNGDIYLYGHVGKDIYLDGKKLVKDIDYYDLQPYYLKLIGGENPQGSSQAGGSDPLPAGRLGIVGVYDNINISKTLNFTGKYLHCASDLVFNEIVWIGGKKTPNGDGYSLTNPANSNSSEYLAPQKTTLIYNGEEGSFYQ